MTKTSFLGWQAGSGSAGSGSAGTLVWAESVGHGPGGRGAAVAA